jgi:hypothetical protein
MGQVSGFETDSLLHSTALCGVAPSHPAAMRILFLLTAIASLCSHVRGQSGTLFPLGDLWSYSDANIDLSATAWTSYFYDDSTWASNYARFGNGNVVVSTSLAGGPSGARYITYYFRKVRTAPNYCLRSALLDTQRCVRCFAEIQQFTTAFSESQRDSVLAGGGWRGCVHQWRRGRPRQHA